MLLCYHSPANRLDHDVHPRFWKADAVLWIQIPIKFACIIIPPQKLILPLQSKWPDKSIKLTYSPLGQECLLSQKSIFQIAGKAELGVLVNTLGKKKPIHFQNIQPSRPVVHFDKCPWLHWTISCQIERFSIEITVTWGSQSSLATPRSLQHLINAFDLAASIAFPYTILLDE